MREAASIGLLDSIPIKFDATRKGPRQIGWRADKGCVLKWCEAQDEGDPAKFPDAAPRDIVYAVDLSKRGDGDGGAPQQIAATDLRYVSLLAWYACTLRLIMCVRVHMRVHAGRVAASNPTPVPRLRVRMILYSSTSRAVMAGTCCADAVA